MMRCRVLRLVRVLPAWVLIPVLCAALTGCILDRDTSVDPPMVVQRSAEHEKMSLKASLVPEAAEVALGEPVSVHVSVYNSSSDTVLFLPMNTALENPLQADVFEVNLDGERLPYIGIIAQRLPPTLSDFVTLEPGESLEHTLDLAQFYLMNRSGSYQIKYVPRTLTVDPALGVEPLPVSVDEQGVVVTVL
jgi:hypothetical protein